jgi:hypothetical protein
MFLLKPREVVVVLHMHLFLQISQNKSRVIWYFIGKKAKIIVLWVIFFKELGPIYNHKRK